MSQNDELFAIRIALQDSYNEEIDIIRELKNYLVNNGVSMDEANNRIYEFYKSFGVDFSLDFIRNSSNLQIASSLFNGEGLETNNISEESINTSDSDDDVVDSDDELPDLEEIEPNQINITNPLQIFDFSNNQIINLNNHNQNLALFDISNVNINHYDLSNNDLSNRVNDIFSNIITSRYPINHSINMNPRSFVNASQIFSNFNNLVNSINQIEQNMEDVKVTLEEDDLKNIKTEILESDLKSKCSICMMDLKKGEEVSTLECEHKFHSGCINHWLKEYNYKCPVCRKECGQAKYHI